MRPFHSFSLALPLVLSVLTAPAPAQIGPGEKAPPVEGDRWLHHRPLSWDAMRSRTVVLVFVRLAEEDSILFLEQIRELRFRFGLDPVLFLAVTPERPEQVAETLEVEEIDIPILFDFDDSLAKAYDVQALPSTVVIAPGGIVAFHGQPGTRQEIEDAVLEVVERGREFPQLPRSMRAIAASLEKWKIERALEQARKMRDRGRLKPEQARALDDLEASAQSLADRLLWTARQAIERERWEIAVTALLRLIEEHPGTPQAETAKKRLDELSARSDLVDEIRAARQFAKAERYERERNWKLAHRTYESIAKTDPETAAGKEAAIRAELLAARARK